MSDNKYRKKPVVVEARIITETENILTAHGRVRAEPGDYILTNPKTNDTWPIKPDIFEATYEKVSDNNTQSANGERKPRYTPEVNDLDGEFYVYDNGEIWWTVNSEQDAKELCDRLNSTASKLERALEVNRELVKALERAKELLYIEFELWEVESDCKHAWNKYQSGPEMQPINKALSLANNEKENSNGQ